MNCPICKADMVMDCKIKIENGRDQKNVKAAVCPFCGKIELYTDISFDEEKK